MRIAVAAGLLLMLAGALQLWDVRRELAAVRAERDALRPQLSVTLVGRTTVETAFRQLAVLGQAGRDAPQWSVVIGGISEELPFESYLTGFRGRADTVGIDGLALSAARVFDAIEAVPQLSSVRASAPVRRETSAEGEALERFQLTALLKRTSPDSITGGVR
jgi:Tfp pilus assembly protein PilN